MNFEFVKDFILIPLFSITYALFSLFISIILLVFLLKVDLEKDTKGCVMKYWKKITFKKF